MDFVHGLVLLPTTRERYEVANDVDAIDLMRRI